MGRGVATLLVLGLWSSVLQAQGVEPGDPAPRPLIWTDTTRFAWDPQAPEPDWVYQVRIVPGGGIGALLDVSCTEVECRGTPGPTLHALMTVPGLKTLTLFVSNPVGVSPDSNAAQITVPATTCPYTPPNGTTVERPLGAVFQGYVPWNGSSGTIPDYFAQRYYQWRKDGWRVWAYPDLGGKGARVAAECTGVPN